MTGKYTPGPWWADSQVEEPGMTCAIIAARTDAGPLPGNPTRGLVGFASAALDCRKDEWHANARLIAAAPDLLEALRKIILAVAMQEKDQLYPVTREGWMMAADDIEDIALAAIAKAEGRA